MGQLEDLIGLHGSFIRLKPGGTWSSSPEHISRDKVTPHMFTFEACFQYVTFPFEEYVLVLKCAGGEKESLI